MSAVREELERRWRQMFGQLAAGHDCPPSLRLRAEGLMEALVIAGECSEGDVQVDMDSVYSECFGRPLAQDFGADWADFYPFPQIPATARRAPVFPSTHD